MNGPADKIQALVRELRWRHGELPAAELARVCGVELAFDSWRVADGRVVYFAECRWRPPRIVVNTAAIELAARSAPAGLVEVERCWFSAAAITEVVIAHELYHLLARRSSSPASEAEAHEFARRLTGVPFSPLRYEQALRRVGSDQALNRAFIVQQATPF